MRYLVIISISHQPPHCYRLAKRPDASVLFLAQCICHEEQHLRACNWRNADCQAPLQIPSNCSAHLFLSSAMWPREDFTKICLNYRMNGVYSRTLNSQPRNAYPSSNCNDKELCVEKKKLSLNIHLSTPDWKLHAEKASIFPTTNPHGNVYWINKSSLETPWLLNLLCLEL